MRSQASCSWQGDLLSGAGALSLNSGVGGDMAVSWASRTLKPGGQTSPEELLAAAYAASYCMQLASEIAARGGAPGSVSVTSVSQFRVGSGVTGIELNVSGDYPDMDGAVLAEAAEAAKANCPIGSLMNGNLEVALTTAINGSTPEPEPAPDEPEVKFYRFTPGRPKRVFA